MSENISTDRGLNVPPGQALVLLVVGEPGQETAELVTSRHPHTAPLRVPAARIAEQAGQTLPPPLSPPTPVRAKPPPRAGSRHVRAPARPAAHGPGPLVSRHTDHMSPGRTP